jgi:hypothetical protein
VLERIQELDSGEMAEVIAVADRLQELLGLGKR